MPYNYTLPSQLVTTKFHCHNFSQLHTSNTTVLGKDRSLLENWRPISLVNVDTKIMTKAIAWRIKKVLPDIIHENQT